MARANTAAEVFRRVTEAGVIRTDTDSPASTTTDAAITAGDTVVSVTDASVFSVGDIVRLDTGLDLEMHEVDSTDETNNDITLRATAGFDHDSGITVEKQTKDVLGDITDDGVTEDLTADMSDIEVATQLRRYTRLVTQVDGRLEFSVENVNTDNLLFSVGIDESEVTGSGTADDPYVAIHDPDKIAEKQLNDIAIYMEGVMDNGDNVEVHGWNAEIDPNRSRTWDTGTGTPVPVAADISTLILRTWS